MKNFEINDGFQHYYSSPNNINYVYNLEKMFDHIVF